jgi:hypothetical protein
MLAYIGFARLKQLDHHLLSQPDRVFLKFGFQSYAAVFALINHYIACVHFICPFINILRSLERANSNGKYISLLSTLFIVFPNRVDQAFSSRAGGSFLASFF